MLWKKIVLSKKLRAVKNHIWLDQISALPTFDFASWRKINVPADFWAMRPMQLRFRKYIPRFLVSKINRVVAILKRIINLPSLCHFKGLFISTYIVLQKHKQITHKKCSSEAKCKQKIAGLSKLPVKSQNFHHAKTRFLYYSAL